jgi:hypothetical protein
MDKVPTVVNGRLASLHSPKLSRARDGAGTGGAYSGPFLAAEFEIADAWSTPHGR